MGTRGYYCIQYKGKYYIYYIRNNAYASYSGVRLLSQLWTEDLDVWRNLLDKIIVVDLDDPPQIPSDAIWLKQLSTKEDDTGDLSAEEDDISDLSTEEDDARDLSTEEDNTGDLSTEEHDTRVSLFEKLRYMIDLDFHKDNFTISDVLSYGYIVQEYDTYPEEEPEISLFIEWVHIIDLDAGSFKVKSRRHGGYRIEFGIEELPLYLCDDHILPGPNEEDCYHCQQSSHAVGKVIYTNMFDMAVTMRIILWRNDGDSIFPHEIWLAILQFFGECCGLDYSNAATIIKMTETSRCNHMQCLRWAILFHSRWLQGKAPNELQTPQIQPYEEDRSVVEGSDGEDGSVILSDAEEGSEILPNTEDSD